MTDDAAEIRRAFDTLGIDPDEIRAADSYGAELDLIVQLRDAAARLAKGELRPVTGHTPPGTEIWHPDYSDDGVRRWFVGPRRDGRGFAHESGLGYQTCEYRYDGWVEVARPEVPPLEVGQWRAMPVRVVRIFDTVSTAVVVTSDGSNEVRTISEIESWPVIPAPEEADHDR